MDIFTTAGADSIASVARKLQRNSFLIGSEDFLLVDETCASNTTEGEVDETCASKITEGEDEEKDDEVETTD